MPIKPTEERQIAGLLKGLSQPVAELVLNRFDPSTRLAVRRHWLQLGEDESLAQLRSFERFLQQSEELTFQAILDFDDRALDTLLELAPADLTISVLRCAPKSFVSRVLSRLDAEEARGVVKALGEASVVNISEMDRTQQRYVALASDLIARGLIAQGVCRALSQAATEQDER